MEFTVRVGEPDVAHRTSWPESTGECSGRPKVFKPNLVYSSKSLVSIALQKEANAALIGTKQDSMLLPNDRVKGAIKQKVLFIFNSIHVAMATDALTCGWFHREPPISFNPEPVRA